MQGVGGGQRRRGENEGKEGREGERMEEEERGEGEGPPETSATSKPSQPQSSHVRKAPLLHWEKPLGLGLLKEF